MNAFIKKPKQNSIAPGSDVRAAGSPFGAAPPSLMSAGFNDYVNGASDAAALPTRMKQNSWMSAPKGKSSGHHVGKKVRC